jgi:mannose-1-phosphate guanylyltransferase
MAQTRVIIIMAGGSGERFWPLSRQQHPKQLLHLTSSNRSLLGEAVDRVRPLVPASNIYVVTGRHLQKAIQQGDLGIPAENVLAEPCKRNTAGCLAYAAAALQAHLNLPASEITMGVITADQQIKSPENFLSALGTAMSAAEDRNALVTMGIRPTRPETGYGYIEVNNAGESDTAASLNNVLPVVRFREKPDRETAARFLATGRFLWNSGMFFWKTSTFLAELQAANPSYHATVEQMTSALKEHDEARVDSLFASLEDVSIDYALLEKSSNVFVVPARFDWDDVGAWDALDRTLSQDENGNTVVGEPILIDTRNCIVYNEPGPGKMAVAVVGGYDLVVVTSQDAVLVAPKSRAQDVKAALAVLKQRGGSQV